MAGELPEAATLKVAVAPLGMVIDAGCVVMAGAVAIVMVAVFEFWVTPFCVTLTQ
jgi:hypothetical protein